jgi:hypothetical protein
VPQPRRRGPIFFIKGVDIGAMIEEQPHARAARTSSICSKNVA